ncbi:unnamed protein product [Caenorhabditis brenneri]
MQRHERIRFFISEQCRSRDPTFRSHFFPKQILLGDQVLPLLEGSQLTFRVNENKKICFRIRLRTDDENIPLNIGMPITQLESISIKEPTKKHPEPTIVFLLKNVALDRFVNIAGPSLDNPVGDGNRRSMSRYLTVLLRNDPAMEVQPNQVYCRVIVQNNKFTFPFTTAKKQLIKDVKCTWLDLLDDELDRRSKTGMTYEREKIAEMDDEAWDWFMGFQKLKWVIDEEGGYCLERRQIVLNDCASIAPSVASGVETDGSEHGNCSVSQTSSPQ